MFSGLNRIIKSYIIKRATRHRAVDIVEVRTKDIGLLSVKTETVLKLLNDFFLPITLLAIHTNLVNREGIKVGKMAYKEPIKLKARSETIIIANSEISSITSVFQALTNLLAQPIYMRSIGTATLKFLWWTVEIEVDDVFEIHPSKLKIRKEETDEERIARLNREEERKAQLVVIREERKQKSADKKEERLMRRHKENYIPKEERKRLNVVSEESDEAASEIFNESTDAANNLNQSEEIRIVPIEQKTKTGTETTILSGESEKIQEE